MNKRMEYQGYEGTVSYSDTDGVLYGKVMGIHSLISYEGNTSDELEENFHQSVEEYLTLCVEEGIVPEKSILNRDVQ